MLRLPVISVVIISMLVNSNPVLPKAVIQKDATETAAIAPPNIEATNTSSIKNDSSTAVTPVNPAENKKESVDVTTAPPKVADINDTIPQRIANPNETEEHKKCSTTMESEDMRGCYATPSDSRENIDDKAAESAAETTTVASVVTKKAEVTKTESQTPKPSPEKPKGKDNETNNNENDNNTNKVIEANVKSNTTIRIVPLIPTKPTNQVTYDMAPTEASHEQNTNDTGNNTKSTTVQPVAVDNATVSTNSVAPLVTDKGANIEPKDVVAQVKSADRNKSMPSGVIALITAMSFGVAVAIVYIGMIVWRRYVEYRYGHRELLVNELEFDTNDLRHFEL